MSIVVIVIILFLLIVISGSKKKQPKTTKQAYRPSPKPAHRATPQPRIVTSPEPAIIDVSGPAEPIRNPNASSPNTPHEVVPWQHQYVFSFHDLTGVTRQQRTYYHYFKQQFLQGHPPDLGENTNYAFILLFDLLRGHYYSKDLRKLHDQLLLLGRTYPKTASYAQREFDQVVLQQSKSGKPNQLAADTIPKADIYQPSWSSIGKRNKKTVAMTDDEANMLDQLFYSSSFFDDPFCQSAIVTIFLALLRSLEQEFGSTKSSLENRLDAVARLICITNYNHTQDKEPDPYNLRYVKNALRQLLMKLCENAVREQYDHKRRLQILPFYNSATEVKVNEALENQLLIPVNRELAGLTHVLPVPDDKGETALNILSPTRWKQKFETIKTSYTQSKDAKTYKTEVMRLGRLNKKNPSVEHIYFEAAKFIGKDDNILCLTLYCYYVYHDQLSAKIDDKQLPKTVLKALFSSTTQESKFGKIITDLKKHKDLKTTLETLPGIYTVERKRIELDRTVIREAEHALDDTVELLNEYLAEEDLSTVEETAAYHAEANANRYLAIVPLNPTQITLLNTFEEKAFSITSEDLETFAREHHTFMSQLVNSLNEAFFETLDDSLIEEEEGHYSMNKDYYKRILQP